MKKMVKKVAVMMMMVMTIVMSSSVAEMAGGCDSAPDPVAQGNAPIGGGNNIELRLLLMPDVALLEEVRGSIVSGMVPEWPVMLPEVGSVETLRHEVVFGTVSEPLWPISDGGGVFEEMPEETLIA